LDLIGTNLSKANLTKANLAWINLTKKDLHETNLTEADLSYTILVDTDFHKADLTGCRIHGISAWNVNLEGTIQGNLVRTHQDEPTVTVDHLEVAQFIYLLLNNEKIRSVIDTIGKKAVLILGRFTQSARSC
jgi:uncharacterized protein YjbI with pentapeptide repeats